ncbi:MAG TPA: metallophosphoesterase, partial [Candidatus Saccharimonadales bacterium]|nr:metallophosphoesterase [Candidatus Saccharimonadales bacterium]
MRHLSAGALLGLGLWPGCASTASKERTARLKPFRFIVVNDTHYMSAECGEWLARVVQQMRTHKDAEFCLHLGDLTEKGERAHLGAVREIFHTLKLPVYVQIGNHDYLTHTDRKAYEELFPNRLNYSFEHGGCQFVSVDSSEGAHYEHTSIGKATLAWVDKQLPRLEKSKPTILFTHFPLGEGITYRPANAEDLLKRFLDFNLQAVFSGHFHGFTEKKFSEATLTTNACCAL